jgi:sugar transferase (PEP-CTERM system associated)
MHVRVLGQRIPMSTAVLTAVEGAIFFFALLAAAWMRFRSPFVDIEETYGPLWPRALLFSAVMVTSMLAFGLYSGRQRARAFGILVRVVAAALVCLAATVVFFYLIPNLYIGRGVLAFAVVGAVAGVVVSRVVMTRVVGDETFKRRVLVYGSGRSASTIANLRRRTDRRGFTVVGFVQAPNEPRVVADDRMLKVGDGGLRELCERYGIEEVVVAMEDRRRGFPARDLLECRLAGIEIIELLTLLERETGRVRIDALNPSWMIFGDGFRRDMFRLLSSRVLDLTASVVIVILAAPLMLLTALAIKLEDGWRAPIFYRQERVGLGGRTFELLKFRSMRTDAEKAGQAIWAAKNDARVTRVGNIIRKLRIDELPQILNVLRNDMSFVGPRPERPTFVAELAEKIPYYVQRHCVKPGVTGWAQLCYPYGSCEQDALEKLQYDLYYIKNNCFLFDLSILVQTVEVVFMGKGAR